LSFFRSGKAEYTQCPRILNTPSRALETRNNKQRQKPQNETDYALPPPQPKVHAPSARTSKITIVLVLDLLALNQQFYAMLGESGSTRLTMDNDFR
jgi:hypothetical protein